MYIGQLLMDGITLSLGGYLNNRFCIQWGSYYTTASATLNWPTTFTNFYISIGYGVGNVNTSFAAVELPYYCTPTGFYSFGR